MPMMVIDILCTLGTAHRSHNQYTTTLSLCSSSPCTSQQSVQVRSDSSTLYTTAGPLGVLAYKWIQDGEVSLLGKFETDAPMVAPAPAAGSAPGGDGDKEGEAQPIPVPGGAGVCYIAFCAKAAASAEGDLTGAGGGLLCANYDAGSVAVLPAISNVAGTATATGTTAADFPGALGAPTSAKHVNPGAEATVEGSRQDASHPHGIFVDPSEKWALACDLGR